MSVAPSGRLATPLHQLRALVMSSTAWQSWIGAGIDPGNRVFVGECSRLISRPYAILYWDASLSGRRDGCGVGSFLRTGSIMLGIVADVPTGYDDIDAETDFLNHLDAVVANLESASNSGGQSLTITGWQVTDGPLRIPEDQRKKHGDRIMAEIAFDVEVWQ